MDREKLKYAAIDYSTYTDSDDYDVTMYNAFIDSADWLMQQPLSERLTDEEKKKITQVYRQASYPSNRYTFISQTVLRLFPSIFGKDLFNDN